MSHGSPPTTPLIGDRFEVLEMVGSGGAGNVWRAIDHERGDAAALKVAHDATLSEPELRRRFVQEAELLASLDHPGILSMRAWSGPQAERPWMATDFCARGSVIDLTLAEGRPPVAEVAEWSLQLLDALHYLHNMGMMHRDIKPENVLVDADGCAVLADFGVARVPTSSATLAGDLFGTPAYMAPEQLADVTQAVPQSDLYSVGAMMFALVTGRGGASLATSRDRALERVPEPLRPVVDRSTRWEAAERYPSAAAMAAELADALELLG